jgi:sulfhydrogenase subunit alpha
MKRNLDIDVHHLTRVEGHGNIKVKIEFGELKEASWKVVETPRYFEAMLRDKHYSSAGILTSRICGICSIGHCLASLRATENAFGIDIPETAEKLRLLAKHGETLQSHVLHVFFLAAPDFFNLPDVISLLEKESRVYDLIRRLRSLADTLSYTEVTRRSRSSAMASKSSDPQLRQEMETALLGLAERVGPELTGLPTVTPFIQASPQIVNIAARLKLLANRICDIVAGRTTHPVSLQVGGVAMAPDPDVLAALRDDINSALDDLSFAVDLFKTFSIPDFVRETEFVSLKGENDYPFIGGGMISTDGMERRENQYLEMTNEYVVPDNTSKWTRLSRDSFAVGALARFNNNSRLLHPEAKNVATALGLEPVCHNPFMNNVAQLVECTHVLYDSIRLIDELIDDGMTEIMTPVKPKAGEGVGAVEVPRGILYHHYKYDKGGRIASANCIIPTTQNNANIHLDMKALVQQFAADGVSDSQLKLLCSMLVRAYDPCISCSVH